MRTSVERKKLLTRIENLLDGPLIVLGFVWLVLIVIELLFESSPILEAISYFIWIIFVIDFLLKFAIAPNKLSYVKGNVLILISLIVPAFRVFRIFRVLRILRLTRSLRLVRIIGSINRSIKALSATMEKRAFGYVLLVTTIIILAGSAGMYAFEKDVEGGLNDYGTALWWTTMIMTTLGSEYWPQTPEGRVLCVVLSLFAFAIFGYITATIATYFLGRDAKEDQTSHQIELLRKEVAELKGILRDLNRESKP